MNPSLSSIAGIPIVIDNMLGWHTDYKQYKFPKSKKKRIRNKWACNPKYFHIVRRQEPIAYQLGLRLVVNTPTLTALKQNVISPPTSPTCSSDLQSP